MQDNFQSVCFPLKEVCAQWCQCLNIQCTIWHATIFQLWGCPRTPRTFQLTCQQHLWKMSWNPPSKGPHNGCPRCSNLHLQSADWQLVDLAQVYQDGNQICIQSNLLPALIMEKGFYLGKVLSCHKPCTATGHVTSHFCTWTFPTHRLFLKV